MKTFLDRFRRKGKGDEPSEGVPDLFGNAGASAAGTKPGEAPGNGLPADAKRAGIALTPMLATPVRASDTEVRLELGDFLHRIPQNLLRPGPHDVSTELLFNINELSGLIANGQTSINLVEIHRRAPGIFRREVRAEDNIEIRFPWQRLMHLVKSPGDRGTGVVGITPAAAEALAHKIRTRRPVRNILPSAGASQEKSSATAPTPAFCEPLSPEKTGPPAQPATEGSQQLSWFGKPGTEQPPVMPPSPAPKKAARPPAQAAVPITPPPAQSVAAAVETPGAFNLDELVRAREAATLKLAETRADFERQTEALAAQREAIAAERDRAMAELERAKAELAANIRDIKRHEQLGAKQAQGTNETIAQREALEKEVAAKDARLAALGDEIAAFKKGGDEKAGAMAQEHDALLAELANVRKELAGKSEQIEFQQSLGAKSAEDAATLAAERQALQRQIAEQAAALDALKSELDGLRRGGGKKYAAVAEERDKVLADLQQTRKELAEKIDQIEFQQSLGAKNAEDVARLATEREALQNELNARTGDLEATRAQLDELAKSSGEKFASVAAERDRVAADLETIRKELAEKLGQVELQQNLGAKSAEEAARLTAERESLQNEVTGKNAELEAIKVELHELRKGSGEQFSAVAEERDNIRAELTRARDELAAKSAQFGVLTANLESHKKAGEKMSVVTQERDSLLQQKTTLAAQLAQATANLAAKQKAVVEVDLSRKENQRQIEELQRRISAFESGQRATSQELNRERETRIKAERSLAAAERARQEASALVESMRSETKRESDAASRKREAESARAHKELQERIEAMTEANRKAIAERDERIQEIEKIRTEAAAAVEAAKSAIVVDAAKGAQWESRAIAGLEDDIAKYRERIKALLLERDTAAEAAKTQIEVLVREREVIAENLAHANSAVGKSESEHKSAIEQLEAKVSAIEQEKAAALQELNRARQTIAQHSGQFAAARAAADAVAGTVAELRQQIEKLSAERDSVQADWEKLFAELDESKAQAKRQGEKFASERAELEKASGTALSDLRSRAAELQQSLDVVTSERAGLHKKLDAAATDLKHIESEREQQLATHRAEHASLLAKHQSASADFARNLDEHEKTVAGLRTEIGDLKTALDAQPQKENDLQKKIDEAAAHLDRAKAEHSEALKDHEKIATGLRGEIEELKKSAAAVTGDRGQLQKKLEAEKAELKKARSEHEKQQAAMRAEHSALQSAHQKVSSDLAASAADLERTKSEYENQLAAAERATAEIADRAKTLAALTRERDELVAKLDETKQTLTAQIAALTDERNESRRESAALAQRLAAFAMESDRKREELERAHAAVTSERQSLAAELESAKESHKAQSSVFAREFKGVVKQRDEMAGDLEAAHSEIQEKSAALARGKANLERIESGVASRFEREITRMRRERDALIRQRDELRGRITKMVDEQRELLEELNAQTMRRSPMPNDVMQSARAVKETNVIEITSAQVVPEVESERAINLQRIRPVPIPPPNVRIL